MVEAQLITYYKQCAICTIDKTIDNFRWTVRDKYRSTKCKTCESKIAQENGYKISNRICSNIKCNNKLRNYQKKFCSNICSNDGWYDRLSLAKKEDIRNRISKAQKRFYHNIDPSWVSDHRRDAANKQWADYNYKIIMSSKRRDMWKDPEYRRLMRGAHAVGMYNSNKMGMLPYASSYEAQAFEILDSDPSVVKYEQEPFAVPFIWKKEIRNCYPDLLVTYQNSSVRLIEIKSTWYLSDAKNLAKIKGMKNYCIQNNISFSLWTELQLEILRILFLDSEWRERELDVLVTKLKSALL